MEAPVGVGQIVAGKYEVERVLARGGTGLVVKARHLQLLEPCAIKFMLPEVLGTPMARERFLREARACARLKSDHVVRIFDVGELDAETPYMVLEYLEGADLEDHLDRCRPLPVAETAVYVLQMCAALAEAHALGIIHRDLKPANVFLARLPDGTTRVKLLDFGISKVLEGAAGVDQSQTVEGTIMGTPLFMAPEQARGDEVDARTDIWAVGVILYNLLTGRLPFESNQSMRTLAYVLSREPVPPSRHLPSIPPALEQLILRCLQKDPAARPASVNEIAAAIAPFAEGEGALLSLHVRRIFESSADGRPSLPQIDLPVTAARRPTARTLLDPQRPRWMVPAVISALVVAVLLGGALAPRSPESSPPPAALHAGDAVINAAPALPAVAPSPVVSAKPAPPRDTPAPPRSTVLSRSAGFDLGSRR
jgi:eukaryotic-like serine/threonine-protein kinase